MSVSDSFIREVDEDLQRDRLQRIWRRYGVLVAALAVLIVAATAAIVGYGWWNERARANQGEAFAAAASRMNDDPAAAADLYAGLADDLGGDPAAVALLFEADARLNANQPDAATAALETARDTGEDAILDDAAALLAAMHRLDAGDAEAAAEDLAPLVAADRPFRHSAKEMLALTHLARGETDAAVARLREVAGAPMAPQGLRARAAALLAALGAPLADADAAEGDGADDGGAS